MTRRQLILALVLVAIIVGAGGAAIHQWRQQQRAAVVRAALPEIPDLIRWPGDMVADVQDTTAEARVSSRPVRALGRLAALYVVNGFDDQARSALAALRQVEPANARWPYLVAEVQRRNDDAAAAAESMEAVVALDPTYAPAWIRLGDLMREQQNLQRAEECYVQAVTNEPGDVRAQFALISFEAWHGRRVDPRQSLSDLAQQHPGIRELHELLARLHAAAGDQTRAAQERRRAAGASRVLGLADPWLDELQSLCYDPNRLGLAAQRRAREKRLPAAEALLKHAIELSPGDATPRRVLASLYEDNERLADARALLETALTECPDDPALPVALARVLSRMHRLLDAAAVARAALVRWPQRGDLHAALGFALRDAREHEEAVPELREAVRLDSTLVEAHYALGFCLLALRQREEARTWVEAALAMRPNYPEALILLGSLALETGDLELAQHHLHRLHELQPDVPGSRMLFSALHLARGNEAQHAGRLDEAEQLYRTGLDVSPEFAPLLKEAAQLAARRADYARVTDLFERYLRLEPRALEVYAPLADAYREIGRPELEERALERGLEMAGKLGDQARIEEFDRLLYE